MSTTATAAPPTIATTTTSSAVIVLSRPNVSARVAASGERFGDVTLQALGALGPRS